MNLLLVTSMMAGRERLDGESDIASQISDDIKGNIRASQRLDDHRTDGESGMCHKITDDPSKDHKAIRRANHQANRD